MNRLININDPVYETNNTIVTGDNFESFLRKLKSDLDSDEIHRIKHSTIKILSNCIPSKFEKANYEENTGLVLGYIQSGKTLSFTSLIALASDNDYKVIIILAGTTNLLLDQTVERLHEDLDNRDKFFILEEASIKMASEVKSVINNNFRKRTIILPILKHYKHIEKLSELFDSHELKPLLRKLGVLIIDDEADQASLNSLARKNFKKSKKSSLNEDEDNYLDFSTTYEKISILKSIIPNHSYIQYTATPQANLLLDQRDLLRPSWIELLYPGNKYTGGRVFFKGNLDLIQEIEKENFKDQLDPEMPEDLNNAFLLFLIESALLCYDFKNCKRLRPKLKLTSMMIHADRLIKVNDIYFRWLENLKENIILDLKNSEDETIENLKDIFKSVKQKLNQYFDNFPSFEETIIKIRYWVLEEIKFWFVAGKRDDEVKWKSKTHHILVGGQKLDRGYTVKNLVITYMPRSTNSKSNADTIEQRCRFFGYKKDYIESCKVFLPQESIDEFEEYVEFEHHLRSFLEEYSIDEFYNNNRLMKFCKLNPTSQNKIPGELIRNNFRRFTYFQPDFENLTKNDFEITKYLKSSDEIGVLEPLKNNSLDNRHRLFQSNIETLIQLLYSLNFNSIRENVKKKQLLDVLKKFDLKSKIWVIEIAFERENGRPRTLNINNHIKSLASNYPPTFGDRDLLIEAKDSRGYYLNYNNEPIIQFHKINILDNDKYSKETKELVGKILYVLSITLNNKKSTSSLISVSYD